jgi:hypothetical protein
MMPLLARKIRQLSFFSGGCAHFADKDFLDRGNHPFGERNPSFSLDEI